VIGVSCIAGVQAVLQYVQGVGAPALYTAGGVRVMSQGFTYFMFSFLLCTALITANAGSRRLLFLAALVNLAALAVTFQRAGYLGALLGFAFLYWVAAQSGIRRRVLRHAGLLALLLAVAYMGYGMRGSTLDNPVVAVWSRLTSIGAYEEDVSALHRLAEWQAALEMIGERPLMGSGPGARVEFFSPMYSATLGRMGYWSADYYVHNSYLWIMTKLGLIGAVLFLCVLGLAFREVARRRRIDLPPLDRALLNGFAACLLALVITSLFGPMFNTDNQTPFVALSLAALFVAGSPAAAGVGETGRGGAGQRRE
jgi:O-antigen ligase